MSKTVIVLFGGTSNENEVSVITGVMVCNVLKNRGYGVLPVYIAQNGSAYTGANLCDISSFKTEGYLDCVRAVVADGGLYTLNKRGRLKKFVRADVALNCCHGGKSEGGAVSGLCAAAGLPFASAGLFESSAFMNKYLTKIVLGGLGVKTLEYAYVKSAEELNSCVDMPRFPVIVKPVNLGSSIGVSRADTAEEALLALECALTYDEGAIIEKYVENRREINCAAYLSDGRVVTSECEEPLSDGDVFSFEEKYQGGAKSVFPANIPPDMSQLIKKTTAEVYEKLGMRGIVRFDYIIDGDEVYVSEINTVPGSLSYYLLSGGFKDFKRVLDGVIAQAEEDFKAFKSKKLLHTGILENLSSNACKTGRK